ncbi:MULTISPECIES: hypothetical protein [Pseudomonadota]|uniref:hypothetical protein n=1 Tax=Pseudomonadota TaxID=1224 RepID=UPI000B31CE01|nr:MULTISPECIES: hypothetical protein [Pseudomonadota]
MAVKRALVERWKSRRGRGVQLRLPFDDIMEFAIALLSISPQELELLGWSFADRKRLLDHFLASGRAAQETDPEALGATPIELTIPRADLERLRRFAVREFPKAASHAAVAERVLRAIEAVPDRRRGSEGR